MKYIYELIGAFFLVFTIGMVVLPPNNAGFLAPLAIGSVLAVLVYAGARISGGHYNPAVSLAVYMRGSLSKKTLFKYWGAQILGSVIAGIMVLFFKGEFFVEIMPLDTLSGFIAELLFTFLLCFVVLNVAPAPKNDCNCFYGFAIGFTVLAGSYAVGTLSGGAFNPAVNVGLAIMNISTWPSVAIFAIAQFMGSIIAALTVKAASRNNL